MTPLLLTSDKLNINIGLQHVIAVQGFFMQDSRRGISGGFKIYLHDQIFPKMANFNMLFCIVLLRKGGSGNQETLSAHI